MGEDEEQREKKNFFIKWDMERRRRENENFFKKGRWEEEEIKENLKEHGRKKGRGIEAM